MCKDRPCLNYHINQCSAPCQGYISEEEYKESVRQVIDFLNGNYSEILNKLKDKMMEASDKMEYEDAAQYRDLITSVKQIAQKQKITDSDFEDRDVIACAIQGDDAVVQVFFIRGGKLLGREHFHMNVAASDSRMEIVQEFMKQYYGGTPYMPGIIMVQDELSEKISSVNGLLQDADLRCQFLCLRRVQGKRWLSLHSRMHRWFLIRIMRESKMNRRRRSVQCRRLLTGSTLER